MSCGENLYIWQAQDWPHWRYDLPRLAQPLAAVSQAQGILLGRLADAGLVLRDQASLAALTEDVLKTSEIEGERLNVQSVRSSLARRLGVDTSKWAAIAKCSPDTVLRDITQLLDWGVLQKAPGGGRSSGYVLGEDWETP